MKCVDSAEVMRLFAGQLSVERTELLNAHFDRCATCAALRDELGAMTTHLRHDPGEFDDPAALDEVITLIRMGKAEKAAESVSRPSFWRSWQTWLLVPATAAATAVLMLAFWPRDGGEDPDEFQARGNEAVNLDRWVSLQVFRATPHGYQPVRDVVAADDALAFAYLNPSSAELRYLAVFGVDDHGDVFWYYPPSADGDGSSQSISIGSGAQPVALPEQVAHRLQPGPFRIFGVFSPAPLSVQAMEDQVKHDLDAARTVERLIHLNLDGVGQYSSLLRVEAPTDARSNR